MLKVNCFSFILLIILLIRTSSGNTFQCDVSAEKTLFLHHTLNSSEYITDANSLQPNITTYIIVHGWKSNITKHGWFIDTLATKLLEFENCNIVLVDYQEYASKFYNCALKIVQTVGTYVGEFLTAAIEEFEFSGDRIHMIGHSLGAHVSGKAAREVHQVTGQRIRRISALDPAGPLFQSMITSENQVLRKTDADIVDVLHCTVVFGKIRPLGTVDFYAGGFLGFQLSLLQRPCLFKKIGCSHRICKEYYAESINSCAIRGTNTETDEIAVYGHHMQENLSGTFKFVAKTKPPYGEWDSDCSKV